MIENIGKVIKWVWTKQKAVLLTTIIFLAVTLLKKFLTAYYDNFDWFYQPMINFMKLIKIIALLFVAIAIVNQIKRWRVLFSITPCFYFYMRVRFIYKSKI